MKAMEVCVVKWNEILFNCQWCTFSWDYLFFNGSKGISDITVDLFRSAVDFGTTIKVFYVVPLLSFSLCKSIKVSKRRRGRLHATFF